MSEPVIHVIPEQYYGGAAPKILRKEVSTTQGVSTTAVPKTKSKASPKVLFIVIAAVLFVVVVGGASWYFIRSARPTPPPEPPPAPELPVVVPPEEEPEPVEQPETPPVEEPVEPPPPPSQDTDEDGLSNTEEVLYGSQVSVPDTDRDGYIDGHEVINLYNPSGIAPERLEDAGYAKPYRNEALGYAVLIPSLWQATASLENPDLIFVQDRTGKNVFELWVIDTIPEGMLEWTTNKYGFSGLISPDGRQAYFSSEQKIYILQYTAEQDTDEYKTTFGVLLNSFEAT